MTEPSTAPFLRGNNGVDRTRPFDRWFRYPAGFSPATLARCFEAARVKSGGLVLDPFAGAATAGVEALSRGASFFGIEGHPLIAELGNLKLCIPDPVPELAASAQEIAASAPRGNLDGETDLVSRCFDHKTLEALVGLRDAIAEAPETVRPYLKWALVATLREVASSKVGWPHQRPSRPRKPRYSEPEKRFAQRAGMIEEDLTKGHGTDATGLVIQGDSRTGRPWARMPQKAAACISSPPYLNNFDYADATRLELYFLGVARTWAEMCAAVRDPLVVATTQQSTKLACEKASKGLKKAAPKLAQEVFALRDDLNAERRSRRQGKEYDLMVVLYFHDIVRVLTHLHQALEPGARVAWVIADSAPYGVYVDTPALIARAAVELGFDFVSTEQLRRRGQRWAHHGQRHEVELDERLIVLRRPA